MNTIAKEWDSYAAKVVPKNAGAVQVSETRQGFYAGAAAALNIMTTVGERNVSEAVGVAIIAGMHDELQRFVASVVARG